MSFNRKKILGAGVCLCALVMAAALSAEIVERIMARVNEEIITMHEVGLKTEQMRGEYRKARRTIPRNIDELALDELINEKLIVQMAKREGVVASRLEVEERVERIMKSRNLTLPQFRQLLREEGTTYEAFFEQMRLKMIVQKLYSKSRRDEEKDLTPSDAEIEAAYKKQKPQQYQVMHMFVPLAAQASFSDRRDAEARIARIETALRQNKANFATIARQNGARFKDYGFIVPNPDLPRFLFPVFNNPQTGKLEQFRVVDEIPGYAGFHAVYLRARRDMPFEEAKPMLSNLVFEEKLAAAMDEWVKTLRKDALIVVNK